MSTVLIADDEEPLLAVLCDVVSGLGHSVVRAADGEEALTLARSQAPDLVITDQMMPRRTGTELIKSLRAEPALAKVPVILLSVMRPPGGEAASLFLTKPVKLDRFEQAVSSFLKGDGQGVFKKLHRTSDRGGISSASRALEEGLRWVAHEVKTPLSAAQMASHMILKRLETIGDPADRRRVQLILRQLDRINDLVTSVLDAARLTDGRVELSPAEHDLAPFLEELVTEWRSLQPDHEIVLESLPVRLVFDAERVRQILNNLVSNAVKYGAPGKKIEVTVSLSPALASIGVRDHGPGIEAAEIPRLYERFHRAHSGGVGHGLGLYIAAQLARLHGGSLSVRSELGQGSTFTLSLPRVL